LTKLFTRDMYLADSLKRMKSTASFARHLRELNSLKSLKMHVVVYDHNSIKVKWSEQKLNK
jgi:hypothetical protein